MPEAVPPAQASAFAALPLSSRSMRSNASSAGGTSNHLLPDGAPASATLTGDEGSPPIDVPALRMKSARLEAENSDLMSEIRALKRQVKVS